MKHSNQRDICKSCHLWSLFVCFVGNSLEPYCNAFIKKIIFIAGNRFSWTDCKNCGVSRSIIWLCHLQRLFYSPHHLISFSQQNKLGEHWQLACSIFIIQKVWGLSRPRLLAVLWNWKLLSGHFQRWKSGPVSFGTVLPFLLWDKKLWTQISVFKTDYWIGGSYI